MSNSYLLTLEGIGKSFPGVKALSGVNLQIAPGEVHALVGENGAGKSTLIKILAGVLQPDEGKITVQGKDKVLSDARVASEAGISVIFQDFSLFPNLSVAENICFNLHTSKHAKLIHWRTMDRIAQKALDEIELHVATSTLVKNLSIATQQMVAIAKALVLQSKVVIMDEPTSSLSSGEVEHLFKIIENLKKKGVTTIFISHKLDEVFHVADRISVLRDGNMIGTYQADELTEQQLIAYMVGRELFAQHYERSENGEVVLEVRHLCKKKNYKDINFTVRAGEVVSITGLVGSGRSELATSIFGLNHPDSGEIFLHGKKVKISSSGKAMKMGMAFIPESRQREGLVMHQDVKRNITITRLADMKNKFGLLSNNKECSLAQEQIEKLDVRPSNPDMMIENLSGGNQQKVVVAKWLATHPQFLIIDEPTNGVDVGAKSEIYRLIRDLARQGMAVLMVSSDLPEVLAVSDTVLVMRKGRLVAKMNVDDTDQEKIMEHALLGMPYQVNHEDIVGKEVGTK